MAANAKEERKVRIYKILTAISILALIAFTIVTSVYYSSKERTMEVPKNETKSIPHTSAPGAEILRVARSTETESMEENIPTLEPFAPPYPDSCKVNNDCDWGYRCIAKACYPGCDSQADCRKPHLCQHWIHDGPSFKYCLVKPHQTCREHLAFCSKNNECCSGKCKAKGKWKMCQPSGGRGRGRPSDIGGNDEGLDAKQEVHSV
ncbi:hypothetical protein N7532_003303 [Penicillium argentinense]|uniref:Uncharacterized protein n=1 Tax=Penicillium argentinense TaxID=1131581 RepID=A0A9W9FM50_9EURO|nr:uncharacterized protein N7532_003303 [Penicillium argentinense]KAJ5102774.1 hypothetical protein N7532_003303 [Penicillium argentinense]